MPLRKWREVANTKSNTYFIVNWFPHLFCFVFLDTSPFPSLPSKAIYMYAYMYIDTHTFIIYINTFLFSLKINYS